jgi:acyl-CoA synthetase (AMP-forming)/AMP-acid ligase II
MGLATTGEAHFEVDAEIDPSGVRVATFSDLLSACVESRGEAVALQGPRERLTFGEWREGSLRFATLVMQVGCEPGDRVLIHCGNADASAFWIAAVGATTGGLIAVPTNTRLAPQELWRICDSALPRVVVSVDDRAELFEAWASQNGSNLRVIRASQLTSLLQQCDPGTPVAADASDPALILYTSGTTGSPKGVVLTHDAMCRCAATLETHHLGPSSGRIIQTAAPLYSADGAGIHLATALYSGLQTLIEERFDARETLMTASASGTSFYHAVPSMLTLLADAVETGGLAWPGVNVVLVSGAPLSPETASRLHALAPGVRLVNIYGQTESFALQVANSGEMIWEHPDAAGLPVPPAELRIVDPETGRVRRLNEEGDVQFRGPGMMKEYFRDPERTSAAVSREGWLSTGDIGEIRTNGLLYLRGRRNEMIVRGGFNIYPLEVEFALEQHPAVAEVGVIGVPHRVLGEDLVAFIVPYEGATVGAEELRVFCRERLADFKIPRDVRVLGEPLPRSATGTLLRRDLQELALGDTVKRT